jgi:GH25 family lysozyme M1 (1,4-beta-N-acetylmuramidase)
MLKGVDVSVVQGHVDWHQVADAGVRFAFLKCGEGNKGTDPQLGRPGWEVDHRRAAGQSGQDPLFDWNVGHAKAAGILVAPYSFAYPLPHQDGNPVRDPEIQAKFHFDLSLGLGSIRGDLTPMLDFEWPAPVDWAKWGCSSNQMVDWLELYLGAADAYWGTKLGCYTYPDFWHHLTVGLDAEHAAKLVAICAGRIFWPADYPNPGRWPSDIERPRAFAPFGNPTFWQFSGGQMAMPDVLLGDENALRGLAGLDPLP